MDLIPNPKEVGERIRSVRKNLGLSMAEFATRIDDKAKSGTVSNWETGKNLPNNERLKRIAELGNVTIGFLLHGSTIDFLVTNIESLVADEYVDLVKVINQDWVFFLSKKISEKGVSVFETEKIKSIINKYLPAIVDDFIRYHDERLNFIANNKKYKEQCTEYFSSTNSSFDVTGIEKVKYIFENATYLTLGEKISLCSNIEEIYLYLDSVSNNRPIFLETAAFLLDTNTLINITDIGFGDDIQLKTHEIFYKASNKPFPNKYKHHHLLIEINNDDVYEFVKKGNHILVHYFPDLNHELLTKYFTHEKVVVIYNKKLYIGSLDENLIFNSINIKELNLSNINIKNSVFPLAAIFY